MRARVLLVITKSELGGAPRYIYSLATSLPRYGVEAVVACGGTDWMVERLRADGVMVIQIPQLAPDRVFRAWTEVSALVSLYQVARAGAFDIVHANSTRAGFLARLAAHAANVPVVIFTAHGFFFEEPMSRPRRSLYCFAERMAARFTDAIITVSEADRRAALRWRICPPDKLITIRNGLDKEQLRQGYWQEPVGEGTAIRRRLGPGPIVGTVAMLYPTKGVGYLIAAAAQVRQAFPTVRFLIVGDGPERAALEGLVAQANLSDTVIFEGRRDEVRPFLQSFDLFVLPSVKEGLPYAILEAMAAGKPIVATRVGGVPEIIVDGRSGIVVPPGDSDRLAEAIIHMLTHPDEATARGEEARRAIMREEFSADSMVAKTARLYTQLLADKRITLWRGYAP